MNDAGTLPSVFAPGNVALVTGAASGIGLAAARRFAGLGMSVVLADLGGPALERAAAEVAEAAASDVLAAATDVSQRSQFERLRAEVEQRFGTVSVLMNNAGVGNNPGLPWENGDAWQKLVDVNLWGVVHGVQAFLPGMLASGKPGLVINTGSKQGITSPPGNYGYNLSKAALRNYSESLAHALRGACAGQWTTSFSIGLHFRVGTRTSKPNSHASWPFREN